MANFDLGTPIQIVRLIQNRFKALLKICHKEAEIIATKNQLLDRSVDYELSKRDFILFARRFVYFQLDKITQNFDEKLLPALNNIYYYHNNSYEVILSQLHKTLDEINTEVEKYLVRYTTQGALRDFKFASTTIRDIQFELNDIETKLRNFTPNQSLFKIQQTKKKTPTAPAIALFCNLINEAEIIKKESNEIPEIYCKRICKKYNLKYTDRIRQNFNGNKSQKHYKELTELILPCIDETTKDKIQKHLDSKNPPKQKLYA